MASTYTVTGHWGRGGFKRDLRGKGPKSGEVSFIDTGSTKITQ